MKVDLARVCDILRPVRDPVQIEPGELYSPIGVRSFANGLIRYPSCPGSELSKLRYFKLPPGSLVLSNIKAWEGAVALAAPEDEHLIASNRFLTYLPINNEVSLEYVWNYFVSDRGTSSLAQASPGSADRNRTLGIKAFERLEIPLPDIQVQCAIVGRLGPIARLGESLKAERAAQQERILALRRHAFASGSANATPTPLKSVVTEVRRDVPVDAKRSYSMLGVRSFGKGAFDAGPLRGDSTAYNRLREVRAGDLVYPKLMAWEGAFSVVPPGLDRYFVSPEFCTFELNQERIDVAFARHYFSHRAFVTQFGTSATGTNVRRRRLQPSSFIELMIPLPSIDEQQAIVRGLDRLQEVGQLAERQKILVDALPRAARNEVFAELS